MRIKSILLLSLLLSSPAYAQSGEAMARGVSWVSMSTNIALSTKEAWDSPNRTRSLLLEGGGLAALNLTTLAVKHFFPRERPCAPANCGSDNPNASFWSGHTGNACYAIPLSSGKAGVAIGASLAAVTALGRIIGNRHHVLDTVAGCAGGMGFKLLTRHFERR